MNEPTTHRQEITALAHHFGNHPSRLVVWDEGSIAARLPSGRLVVSTAGAPLAKLEASHLVEVDLARAQALALQDEVSEDELAQALPGRAEGGPAPTEDLFPYAGLFAFEDVQFAAHTQPIPVNQILSSPRARQFADRRNFPQEVLACGAASVLAPFHPTGLALAKEIQRKLILWKDRYKGTPRVVLIQNYGMIALGATIEEVRLRTEMTVKYAEIFLGAAMLGGPDFLKPTYVAQLEADASA